MAESNKRIIENLTKEVENYHIDNVAPPFEEFHDAEGPSSEHDSVLNESDESVSDEEELSKKEIELSREEIEVL